MSNPAIDRRFTSGSRPASNAVIAAWLGGIVVNLLSYSGFYDVALRDFGLMLAALTLARLASVYDPPLHLRRR